MPNQGRLRQAIEDLVLDKDVVTGRRWMAGVAQHFGVFSSVAAGIGVLFLKLGFRFCEGQEPCFLESREVSVEFDGHVQLDLVSGRSVSSGLIRTPS